MTSELVELIQDKEKGQKKEPKRFEHKTVWMIGTELKK